MTSPMTSWEPAKLEFVAYELAYKLQFGYEEPKDEIDEWGKNISHIYKKLHFLQIGSPEYSKRVYIGPVNTDSNPLRLSSTEFDKMGV